MPTAHQITWAKIRVFTVLLAASSILFVLIYLLTAGTLFQAKSLLYVYIPDAAGLSSASVVRVNGVDVGKVDNISWSGLNQSSRVVKLTLKIERPFLESIPTDSFAQIESDTAAGDKYLAITRGQSAMTVRTGAEISFRAQPELLQTLDITQFTDQLRAVDAQVTQVEQGQNPTGQLLLSDQLYNQVRKVIADFEREIRGLESPQNPIGKMLYTDEGYHRFDDPLRQIDQVIAAMQSGQNRLGNLLQKDTDYNQLITRLTDLRRSLQKLETNNLLVSDEMYSQWNRSLTSLIESIDQFDESPVLSTSEVYDNLTGLANQLRGNVHDFREDPQKFLRIKIF